MEPFKIRERLIEKVNLSDNMDLLEEIYRFLNLENEMQEIYQLTLEQNVAINEARSQIKNGDYLTNDEANLAIDQWLEG